MKSHLNKIFWGIIAIIAVFFIVSKATAQEITDTYFAYANQTISVSAAHAPLTTPHKTDIPTLLRNTSWFGKSEFKFFYLPRHKHSYKNFKQANSNLKIGKFSYARNNRIMKILPSNKMTLTNPKNLG